MNPLCGERDHSREGQKPRQAVKQHQMVCEALKGRMGGELHALALTTAES